MEEEKNKTNIEIADSTPADERSIYEVVRETWLATYPNEEYGITKEDIAAKFLVKDSPKYEEIMRKREENSGTNPNNHSWVAKDNGQVVGFCYVAKHDDSNEVQSVYILPGYQGKGIGKALMEKAFDWVDKDKPLKLGVTTYNTPAREFYKKLGFKETGHAWQTAAAKLPSGKEIPSIEMVKSFTN